MNVSAADRAMLEGIASRGEAIIGRAVEWCSMRSGSYMADGLARQLDALEQAFAPLGAEPERIALADRIEINGRGQEVRSPGGEALLLRHRPDAPRRVLLTGHYDTVYPTASSFVEVRPRGDGALNGPGIADMKGGLSVMLAALEAFRDHPAADTLGWDVLLSSDEEIGSPGSAPLLARRAGDAVVGLTYEPALADGGFASARKGSGNFHIVVTGRAVHVGRDFAGGRNAIVAAAWLATALDGLNGKHAGVRLNVARIDGGGPLNMVPDGAVVRVNMRFDDPAEGAWAEGAIAAIVARPLADGIAATLHGGITRPAKPFTPGQARLFGAVKDIGALLDLDLHWSPSGGVCEGNNLFAAGLPNIDTLGVRGGDIHSEREFAWPASFVERAQLSALVLAKLADGSINPTAFKS